MAWSNKSARTGMSVEKSHSLSFSVRIEDRLHTNIVQDGDECWLTVRPVNFVVGFNDDDIVVGTPSVLGNGIKAVGELIGEDEDTLFNFEIQAAALNLDAELEYWYDITYLRNGYSMSICAGEFEVAANVTNRGAGNSFDGIGDVFQIVSTIDGRNLLTVTSTLPMPSEGPPGNGSYVIAQALSEVVGNTVTIPIASINVPGDRAPQVGDVLFSSITRGVLATIQSISWVGTPSAVVLTRQNYGLQTLKALLDTVLKIVPTGGGPNIETIDYTWSIPKTNVPLPVGYEYRIGDMVFSHSAVSGYAVTKKMLISLIEGTTTTHLNVRTKVVFPMFLDTNDIEDLLESKADSSIQVNGKPLTANVTLNEDDIAAGPTMGKFTLAEKGKLNDLPSVATLTTLLGGKAASAHTHNMVDVNGLGAALDNKVDSTAIDEIWVGTQAQYDAIAVKNARVQYLIKA